MNNYKQEHGGGNAVKTIHYDGLYIYTGGADGLLNVRNPKDLFIEISLAAGATPPARSDELRRYYTFGSIATSSNYLFAGTDRGRIYVWNKSDFSPRPHLAIAGWDYVVEIGANDNVIVGVGYYGNIGIWDLESLVLLKTIPCKLPSCDRVMLSDQFLFLGHHKDGKAEVDVYSLKNLTKFATLKQDSKGWIQDVCPTANYLIVNAGNYSDSETTFFSEISFLTRLSFKKVRRFASPKGWEATGALCANDQFFCTFQKNWNYNVPQNSDKKRRCSKVHHLVCVNNTPRLSKPSSFVRC